jgi:vitamin B12 transporter
MRRFMSVVVVLLVLRAAAAAAEPGAALSGIVRSPDGTPLPHLVLTLSGAGGGRTVLSGPEGRYRVESLTPGDYELAADAPGFRLSPEPRVTVGEGETRLDLALVPAPVREHVVVSATRGEATLSTLGVTATVLDADDIAAREPTTLMPLVQDVPGVSVARAGGVGLQASMFVRGGESRFARILLDGVPVNSPGGAYNFGPVLPLELERVEVVRGAASSLYGTDALAGVVHLVTRRAGPGERLGLHAEADAGGFDWGRVAGGVSGRRGAWDWNAGATYLTTDNEEPNSAFEETAGAASMGLQTGEATWLRLATRLATSTVGTPGQTAYGRPDLDAFSDRDDIAVGVELHHAGGGLTHELRAGYARTNQISRNPLDSGSYLPRSGALVAPFEFFDFTNPEGFLDDTRRLSAGYQVEAQAGARQLLTAGVDVEHESGRLGDLRATLLEPERTNVGAYLQDRLLLGDRVFVTLGGRVEHNDTYGTKAVPRAALAYRLRAGENATTLRASAGAGIKEPSFFESFGVDEFALGNPDLEPERSRTYDLGVEQRLFDSRLRVEATLYRHEYLDQIAFQTLSFVPFRGSYVNLGETRAQGLELAFEAAPTDRVRLTAAYAYLDGEVIVSSSEDPQDPIYRAGRPLLRRPKHQASLGGEAGAGPVVLGATLVIVGQRPDSDFSLLGLTENEGYTRLDARARLSLGHGLEAFVVADNLLDADYEEVLGYPALGRAVRAGLRFRNTH